MRVPMGRVDGRGPPARGSSQPRAVLGSDLRQSIGERRHRRRPRGRSPTCSRRQRPRDRELGVVPRDGEVLGRVVSGGRSGTTCRRSRSAPGSRARSRAGCRSSSAGPRRARRTARCGTSGSRVAGRPRRRRPARRSSAPACPRPVPRGCAARGSRRRRARQAVLQEPARVDAGAAGHVDVEGAAEEAPLVALGLRAKTHDPGRRVWNSCARPLRSPCRPGRGIACPRHQVAAASRTEGGELHVRPAMPSLRGRADPHVRRPRHVAAVRELPRRRPARTDGETFYPLHVRVCDRVPAGAAARRTSPPRTSSATTRTSRRTATRGSRTPPTSSTAPSTRLGARPGLVRGRGGQQRRLPAAARRRDRGIRCLGIEPAANVAEAAVAKGIPTEVRVPGSRRPARTSRREHGRADLVAANNVFAHVPDIVDFSRGLRALVADDGHVTIEIPHLLRLIEGNEYDTIYHEHYSYLSLLTTQRVLAAAGLTVVDVEELPTHGGSLRTWSMPTESRGRRRRGGPGAGRRGGGRPAHARGSRGLRPAVAAGARRLRRVPGRLLARGQARGGRTARRARATRCSTTAASAPT